MGNTKHTPGPWHFEPRKIGSTYANQNQIAGGGSVVTGLSDKIKEADAKLIAAAPDMAEALKAMIECVLKLTVTAKPETQQARAALAKAGVK